jgi:hypothetical protein
VTNERLHHWLVALAGIALLAGLACGRYGPPSRGVPTAAAPAANAASEQLPESPDPADPADSEPEQEP